MSETDIMTTAHSLALELHCADVDAMLDGLSWRQYKNWLRFFSVRHEKAGGQKKPPKAKGHLAVGVNVANFMRGHNRQLKH